MLNSIVKNKKWIILFFVAVGLLLLIEIYIYVSNSNKRKEPYTITFIVDEASSNDYENMKAGAQNAALDSNCIIDFVDESKGDSVNANQIIKVTNDSLSYSKGELKVDDEAMVSDLVDYILADGDYNKYLLVSSGTNENIDNLVSIFEARFSEDDYKVEYRPLSTDSKKLNQSMYNLEQSGLFDCVIALDTETIKAACESNNLTNKFVNVYGMDNSSEAVYYLDTGALGAIAYKDEYSMGYIAVRQLLKDKDINNVAKDRSFYYIADRQTMYSDELEKVLFPFVK